MWITAPINQSIHIWVCCISHLTFSFVQIKMIMGNSVIPSLRKILKLVSKFYVCFTTKFYVCFTTKFYVCFTTKFYVCFTTIFRNKCVHSHTLVWIHEPFLQNFRNMSIVAEWSFAEGTDLFRGAPGWRWH